MLNYETNCKLIANDVKHFEFAFLILRCKFQG